VKISLPLKVAKTPRRISRIFRDPAVVKMFKSKTAISAGNGRRRNAALAFTICPISDGEMCNCNSFIYKIN
jgi:hypothetical protein